MMYMGSGYIVQRGGGKDYSTFKALADRSITEVTAEMLDGVTSIGDNAFNGCSALTSVDIPNGVTSIGDNAFYDCYLLTSVTIPNSVTRIMSSAFSYCSALASITIPSSVTSIWNYAFSNCSALASVTVEATTPPTLGTNAFDGTHADLVIYVPAGSVDTYKSASGWSTYASRIQAIPST